MTVRDVVAQLSPYLMENKQEILDRKAPMLQIEPGARDAKDVPEHIKFLVEGFSNNMIEEEDYSIGVENGAMEEGGAY